MKRKLTLVDSPIEEPIKEGTVWVKGDAFYIYRNEGWELVGPQGKRGERFKYEDFTAAQLEALRGPRGETGPKGEKGEQGERGERGYKGDSGPMGLKGDKGERGPLGPKGDTGETGKQGPVGPKGDRGEKGARFTYSDFTPDQLASLKGAKGDTGPRGAVGPKGEKGDAFTYSDFTQAQLDALKGPKGDKGEKGESFKYSDFTQDQLDALKGERGKKGDVGPQGPQGPAGPIGYGVESVVQTQVSKDSGGLNIITFTLSNGDIESIYLYNGGEGGEGTKGEKGDKGDQGDAGKPISKLRTTKVTDGTQVEFLLEDDTVVGTITVKDGDATDAINACKDATTKAKTATTNADNATSDAKVATKKALDAASMVDSSAHKVVTSVDTNNNFTTKLQDKLGNTISTSTVNIPIESMITGGRYENNKIILTLSNGNSIEIPVADLVKGLVSEQKLQAATDELKVNDSDLLKRIAKEVDDRTYNDVGKNELKLEQTADKYTLTSTITTEDGNKEFKSAVDFPKATKVLDGLMSKEDKTDHDRIVKKVDEFPLVRVGDSNSVMSKDTNNTVTAQNSFAFGTDNKCDDHYTYAFGTHNTTIGSWGFLVGQGNSSDRRSSYAFTVGSGNTFRNNAYASGVIGFHNRIDERYSFAHGFGNIITGEYGTALGQNLEVSNPHETAIGKFNRSLSDASGQSPTILTVGYGGNDTSRLNYLDMRQDMSINAWLPNTLTDQLEYQSIQELFKKKQNKLIAGDRITIDRTTNEITADPYYRIVSDLPDTGKPNQIYLLKGQDEDGNITYTQYGYISGGWKAISSVDIKYKAGDGIKINKEEIKADVIDDKAALTSIKKTWSVSKLIDYFGGPMKFQGQLNEIDDLELVNPKSAGDVYNVVEDHNNYCFVSEEKGWVIIGSSEIDLSDYFTKAQTTTAAQDIANVTVNSYNTDVVQPALNKKQDKEDHDLVTSAKTVVGAITELYNRGQVYYGYTDPSSTLGKDGDLYMKVVK